MALTDAELVKAFKEGDAGALDELISRYKGPLYAYLLKLARDSNAADDLFQEVFVKVIKKLGSYGEEDKFSAWLFTVAHHAIMDHFRAQTRRREESLYAAHGDSRALADTLACDEPSPAAALDAAERAGAIEAAFEKLSPDQREIFLLRHYSGLSFREIAGILKIPIGTALARMSRALAKLRGELGNIS
ncbi:MAG: sigma-70 family RNA polymerase sigma factor [Elusimicrobia bacterium]|nr:sigma-70 family RNA polymerase sigma factor [Elusimicrobiota bacterium]